MSVDNYIPTERFLDASREPQRRLTPIQGYEKKDLVSLEEAVKPLEHLIENIQGFVWTATGNCKNPLEGLTRNERAAIFLYTMECMYCQLNKALRSEDRQQLIAYFSYLKLLLTGLWKLADVKCLVYRGVKGNISQDYPKGKKFVWWGLSSCTTSLNVLQAEQFLGKKETRTLFNIECFNGKHIQNHSQFPNENEVLLLPCSYFEVLSELDQGNGLHIVHIKQIESPVILIQPPSPSFGLCHSSKSSNNIESMTSNFTRMNVSYTASSSKKTNVSPAKKTLNLNMLKDKPRLSMKANVERECVAAANNECLLFSSQDGFVLIDKDGREKLSIESDFNVYDICWSSCLN